MNMLIWKHSPDTLQPADDKFLLRPGSKMEHSGPFSLEI